MATKITRRTRIKSKKTKKGQSSSKPLIILLIFCILALFGFSKISLIKSKLISSVSDVKKTEITKIPAQPTPTKQIVTPIPPVSVRVPILMYHYIEEVTDKRDTIRQSLNINPYIFEQQVKTLKDNGFTFLTASELSDILDGKEQLPAKPVLITIDDGHWDLDTDILPILKKYQVKVTAYIIPGFLNGSDFLSTEQLEDVEQSGFVEIGAHTVHHVWLKGQPLIRVQKEVNGSKTMLEGLIQKPVVSFAYPSGALDQQAEEVVKAAGFKTAVSTKLGITESQSNRYTLFRIRPGGRTGEHLLKYLDQIPSQ